MGLTKRIRMFKLRPIEELVKYERNPRKITEVDLAKLIQSIRDNGEYFNARPIILSDRTGELVIIAGNQRYEAAKFLEMDVVPTYLISGLTEQKEKEILVRDNVNQGTFDHDLLSADFDVIDLEAWGAIPNWNTDIDINETSDSEQSNSPVSGSGELIDQPVIKLEYTYDDYLIVKEQLSKMDSSPERAVWKLLGNK